MKYLKQYLSLALFFLICHIGWTQNTVKPLDQIDVLHYQFHLAVTDSTNVIQGMAQIEITFLKNNPEVDFNLVQNTDGKGMTVSAVLLNNVAVPFSQADDLLKIEVKTTQINSKGTFKITYSGIPKDGLIISKNMFGDRTFFGDNWPNRAHNWLPCVDALADKAFVDFYVTAPNHYQVVANGVLVEQTNLNAHQNFYHWKSSTVLPTDVMVVGIAEFAVQNLSVINGIPISTWVYPQNKTEGFKDYAFAENILKYYEKTVAPYPYKKLANVQSKTRFGGMENASNIFYFEKSVNGKQNHEDLLAHEMAHQWFGDSATEQDWPHLWLSEGFATYFTDLYMEHTHGKSVLDQRLKSQRQKVIAFSVKHQTPVVDTITKNLMALLNPNSYEKGGWFLHMLRRKLGDKLFFKSIKTYYNTYKLGNATTEDFENSIENTSKQDLKAFFNQWLYSVGQPKLDVSYTYNHKKIKLTIKQVQKFETIFDVPLSIRFVFKDQSSIVKTFQINKKAQHFDWPSDKAISKIELDPNTNLLFEAGTVKP